MSWHYVYDYLLQKLEDTEFKKQNALHNPNDPAIALLVAVEHLYVVLKWVHAQKGVKKWRKITVKS